MARKVRWFPNPFVDLTLANFFYFVQCNIGMEAMRSCIDAALHGFLRAIPVFLGYLFRVGRSMIDVESAAQRLHDQSSVRGASCIEVV